VSLPELASLLSPVEDDQPCGRDLELTLELQALEDLAQEPQAAAIAGIEMVDERNWRAIASEAQALLRGSKDLRVALILTRALSHTHGVVGFCRGVSLLSELLSRHWDGLYPGFDEDDGNADLRLNTLRELYSSAQLKVLRQARVVSSQALGTFSTNDLLVATGHPLGRTTDDGGGPAASHVVQSLQQVALDELDELVDALGRARTVLASMGAFLTDRLGRHHFAPSPLSVPPGERGAGLLDALSTIVGESLTRRHPERRGAALASHEIPNEETNASESSPSKSSVPTPLPARLTGEVRSRDDVLNAIDSICRYYAAHEPSSPVPLLMSRAKRVVFMSFMELMEELADQGLPQIALIAGRQSTD
jgi:type VI secretion system protein ImpA